ncbi:hypothetical protein POSPLADRAFT_1042254 [Postia placenta MAD-698-R-SB12]|uniref:Methyltransferase domain-containing protein n=1 Tax=Postia placenta MAD-698-R-SB12 TaxID=670580 RepID=A0A1X6NEM0_9APHY|nr:hypothetical protein POSPLADRAFT_1042254 [Postia placenta MAD-698-R-SB12]OSX66962.1 hypothetical protein POSPLADRAFT_1042254 [Postia placenta MAD-698-R-SB12]
MVAQLGPCHHPSGSLLRPMHKLTCTVHERHGQWFCGGIGASVASCQPTPYLLSHFGRAVSACLVHLGLCLLGHKAPRHLRKHGTITACKAANMAASKRSVDPSTFKLPVTPRRSLDNEFPYRTPHSSAPSPADADSASSRSASLSPAAAGLDNSCHSAYSDLITMRRERHNGSFRALGHFKFSNSSIKFKIVWSGQNPKKGWKPILVEQPTQPGLSSTVSLPRAVSSIRSNADSDAPSLHEDTSFEAGLRRQQGTADGFHNRNRMVTRRGMPHHCHRREEAPYMQSYSRVSLDSELRTYELLRRLNPNCSPSFHNYGKNPPSRVLDLGCGKGYWVLNAARSWKNTKVTGLDLIDVYNMCGKEPHSPESPSEEVHNVEWDRSNFAKDPLPYAEDSFDLVRMANLSLCIPRQRWEFVFSEVWRVLAPGGRLELIDDDLAFPAIAPPPLSVPRLQKSMNRHCVIIGAAPEEVEVAEHDHSTIWPGHTRTVPQAVSEYEENVATCKDLETIFNNMLVERSRFGEGVKKLHEITLAIPSEAYMESADTARPPARRKNSEPVQFVSAPLSPKVTQIFSGNESLRSSRSSKRFQPPGLVLMSTGAFLPFSPSEMEMHVCKNIQTLLSCGDSLTDFMLGKKDTNGQPLLSEDQIQEYLWDYERFRRQRFNLPSDPPGLQMEEEQVEQSTLTSFLRRTANVSPTLSPTRGRSSSAPSFSPQGQLSDDELKELTKVRTFRVWSAVKADHGSPLPTFSS